MCMPIQRQSETYSAFDDGSHRFARDYETRDLPAGLVNMLKGARITAGLNDPRRMAREAGFGSYPDSAGFGREDLSGHGHFDPAAEEQQDPYADPESGYGFSGGGDSSQYSEVPVDHQDPGGFGFGGYEDYDPHSSENLPPPDYGEQFGPHMASFLEARRLTADGGPGNPTEDLNGTVSTYGDEITAAAMQPQVVPGWVGHGYVPGHRVGLPWRNQVIPGTVTHLDGPQVGIRWDDGQHSTEEPSDLRPI